MRTVYLVFSSTSNLRGNLINLKRRFISMFELLAVILLKLHYDDFRNIWLSSTDLCWDAWNLRTQNFTQTVERGPLLGENFKRFLVLPKGISTVFHLKRDGCCLIECKTPIMFFVNMFFVNMFLFSLLVFGCSKIVLITSFGLKLSLFQSFLNSCFFWSFYKNRKT